MKNKTNTDQLRKIFHCVNFLIFFKEISLKEKDEDALLGHASFERELGSHMDVFTKNKSFNKNELVSFTKFYEDLKTLWEADFMKQVNGKPFHVEFDNSSKK
tara:strand:+ start:291 stop:596 length:306 start_codon:yes stop_codon:yes gene_type:complete